MSQLRDLARPFPARLVKDNPSGYGSYVPHGIYKQRLLLTVGPYDFELVSILRGQVKGHEDLGEVVVGVVMRLTATIDGRQVRIEEIGDCESPSNWGHDGARTKDAISDALKRCCPHIGLGLALYNPDNYLLFDALTKREEEAEFAAGPTGGGEPSGQTLVVGDPAGESNDLTVPANLSPAPSEVSGAGDVTVSNGGTDTRSSGGAVGVPASEFCDACLAGDCQHCVEREYGNPEQCGCSHDEGRPM